ncbi:MAG: helicase-associated domain-containing protein [Actinomycetales bacterium]
MSTQSSRRAPRSLADDLRARSDDDLVALLRRRPDLLRPMPGDLASLAARAGTQASVHRALAGLDAATLAVATVLTLVPTPIGLTRLAGACGSTASVVRPMLRQLIDLGLVFGGTRAAQPVRSLRELLGAPIGLGPSVAESLSTSPGRLATVAAALGVPAEVDAVARHLREDTAQVLVQAPPAVSRVLSLLDPSLSPVVPASDQPAAGTADPSRQGDDTAPRADGTGSLDDADRELDPNSRRPVDWLLARALLVPTGPREVAISREAGIGLRGFVLALPQPPNPAPVDPVSLARVERSAPAAATEVVRATEELLATLGDEGGAMLRSGGLGARDLLRIGRRLNLDQRRTALVLVVAAGAGLLGISEDRGGGPAALRPSRLAGEWSQGSTGTRWSRLVQGWLDAPWSPGLTGTRDDRSQLIAALSPASHREAERRLRAQVLAAVAVPVPPVGAEAVQAWLRFAAPRGPVASVPRLIGPILQEAHHLGLMAFDLLADYARPAARGDLSGSADALDAALPAPVSTVHVQADLTAVAPGPLVPSAARLLDLCAEIESRGSATVYRFTPDALGRALDHGLDAAELLAGLAQVSAGPLPQPLEFLVRDVARRHGLLRVGRATSYLRSDDEQALAELTADPGLSGLGLRLLAPTVAVCSLEPARLLEAIRSRGAVAVSENADGSVSTLASGPRQAPPPLSMPVGAIPLEEDDPVTAVQVLRRVDQAQRATAEPPAHTDPARRSPTTDALATLAEAADQARAVWLWLSDARGRPSVHRVQPVRVGAGAAIAVDLSTGRTMTVPVHRITGVATDDGPDRVPHPG